jgi:hypothetical protein
MYMPHRVAPEYAPENMELENAFRAFDEMLDKLMPAV